MYARRSCAPRKRKAQATRTSVVDGTSLNAVPPKIHTAGKNA